MGSIELLSDRVPPSYDLQVDKIFASTTVSELSQEEVGRILKLPSQDEVLNILLVYSNKKYEDLDLISRREMIDIIFNMGIYIKFVEACKTFCIKDLDYDKTKHVLNCISNSKEEFQVRYIRRISELIKINRSSIFTSLIELFIKIEDKDVSTELYSELFELEDSNEDETELKLASILRKYSSSINKVKIKTLPHTTGIRPRIVR